jgi:hypothetical protein
LFPLTLLEAVKEVTLDWISLTDFQAKHRSIALKRVPGTGIWFLENQTFNQWTSGSGSNLLYCPGLGKQLYLLSNVV